VLRNLYLNAIQKSSFSDSEFHSKNDDNVPKSSFSDSEFHSKNDDNVPKSSFSEIVSEFRLRYGGKK